MYGPLVEIHMIEIRALVQRENRQVENQVVVAKAESHELRRKVTVSAGWNKVEFTLTTTYPSFIMQMDRINRFIVQIRRRVGYR